MKFGITAIFPSFVSQAAGYLPFVARNFLDSGHHLQCGFPGGWELGAGHAIDVTWVTLLPCWVNARDSNDRMILHRLAFMSPSGDSCIYDKDQAMYRSQGLEPK